MEEKKIPRNCMDCDNRYSCFRFWYGGNQCKYQEDIRQTVIMEISSIEGDNENGQQPTPTKEGCE